MCLWSMVYGPWSMVYGLWSMVFSISISISSSISRADPTKPSKTLAHQTVVYPNDYTQTKTVANTARTRTALCSV